eukprot:snap_masked-scaffold_25-processed-gene-3.7-mRNA-1 protein AED:1.00 eAED:1.00 QI:0/0/0/0/1/1/4/0/72
MMLPVERGAISSLFRPLGSKNNSSASCCRILFVIPSGPGISSSVSMMFSSLLFYASSRYSWNIFARTFHLPW